MFHRAERAGRRSRFWVWGSDSGRSCFWFLWDTAFRMRLLETITSSGALTALDVAPNEQEGKFLNPAAVEEYEKN